jgi:hypothetical protein
MQRLVSSLAVAVAVLVGLALPAAAQSSGSLTDADIQRLRTAVADARDDIDQFRAKDSSQAATLTRQLDELADEVIYLKVKLRKDKQVPRSEYLDLRDRIDDLRNQAQSNRGSARTSATGSARSQSTEIPVGTELDVRLQDALSSGRNEAEDRFRATTVVDLQVGERVIIPAGSELRGVVSSVDKAGRLDRKGSMTLAFDQITINGRAYPMRGLVTQVLEGEGLKGEAGKLGTGAAAGGIIGGILGGVKGAIAGILIGGGGVAAATPGTDIDLAPGTILRVRLDEPPAMR